MSIFNLIHFNVWCQCLIYLYLYCVRVYFVEPVHLFVFFNILFILFFITLMCTALSLHYSNVDNLSVAPSDPGWIDQGLFIAPRLRAHCYTYSHMYLASRSAKPVQTDWVSGSDLFKVSTLNFNSCILTISKALLNRRHSKY